MKQRILALVPSLAVGLACSPPPQTPGASPDVRDAGAPDAPSETGAAAPCYVTGAGSLPRAQPETDRSRHARVASYPWPESPVSAGGWVRVRSVRLVEPVAGGTLGLFGADRIFWDRRGPALSARERLPEAPVTATLVPTLSVPVIVLQGTRTVYRLADPLGSSSVLMKTDVDIDRIEPGPGVLAVFLAGRAVPEWVDVVSGKAVRRPCGMLASPSSVAFVTVHQGAQVAGKDLRVTSDGGSTWNAVRCAAADDSRCVAAMSEVRGLVIRRDEVFAETGSAGESWRVDFATRALVAPLARGTKDDASEPALLRWVRATSRDPLELAVSDGINLDAGDRLVTARGMVARWNTRTGELHDLRDITQRRDRSCYAATTDREVILSCDGARESAAGAYGTRLWRWPTRTAAREFGAEQSLGASAGVLTGRAGGIALAGRCDATSISAEDAALGQYRTVCVRQPSGSWASRNAEYIHPETRVPLRDGGMAEIVSTVPSASRPLITAYPDAETLALVSRQPASKRLETLASTYLRGYWVVRFTSPSGRSRTLVPVSLDALSGQEVRSARVINEIRPGVVRYFLYSAHKAFVVEQSLTTSSAKVTELGVAGATLMALDPPFALAVSRKSLLFSEDSGVSWREIDTPPELRAVLADEWQVEKCGIEGRLASGAQLCGANVLFSRTPLGPSDRSVPGDARRP